MKIVNYAIFKTNEEFVKWQLDNQPAIIQVQPMVLAFDGAIKSDEAQKETLDASTDIGVFVTYFIDVA